MIMLKLPAWIKPHHARFGMAIASLIGLFASGYLFYTYVTGAPIACGIVSGCDLIRASKWAYSNGIPRPFLGLVFYAGVFGLLVARAATTWRPRMLYQLAMLAAALGFVESGFLFLVQWLDVKAFCLWCLTSALAATAIAVLAFFDRPHEEPRAISATRELRWHFIALLIFLPISFFGFIYLTRIAKHPPTTTTIEPPTTNATSTAPFSPASVLLHPGVPVEGPVMAKVLVVEFGDFQCPACGAFEPTMKKIRDEYRGRIRFAFRNMPLVDLHENAMNAAIAGECANKQGKFFAYADRLYADQSKLSEADFKQDAKALGLDEKAFAACYADPATKAYVEQDRQEAIALGVQFTPTLFVNRVRVDQALPYEELKALIEKELR